MRHRKGGFKLQRNPSARRALLRGLTTNVILRDRVVTTVTKAKAVKPVVEKMITLAKRDTLHSRRQAAAFLNTPGAVQKLFETLGPRFAQRNGGYTRHDDVERVALAGEHLDENGDFGRLGAMGMIAGCHVVDLDIELHGLPERAMPDFG